MRQDVERFEPAAPQPGIRLRNGLILLNLLDLVLILVIIFIPSNMLRIILAVPFFLFFPGYALLLAIFAKKDEIGGVERVVLSSGLSVAVGALIGLIFSFTPWGIRLETILYSIFSLILFTSIIAWLRQRRLTENERFGINLDLSFLNRGKSYKDRALTIITVLVILGALGSLAYFVAIPKERGAFTEFYILGQQGKSAQYPDRLKVGDEGRLIVGITNHERKEVGYSVEVIVNDDKTALLGPIVLVDEQNWEGEVGFVIKVPGEDHKVEFVLHKNNEVEPYKQLHLWVDATK